MSHRRDMQELMRRVRKAGYNTALSNSGHWLVTDQERRLIVTASQTPSDHRSIENTVHELRRAGVELNGATKYESRESVPYPDLPEEQAALLSNLNAAIVELGYDPNAKRSGANSDITARVIRREGKDAPSADAFTQVMSKLRKGQPISSRSERLLRVEVEAILQNAIAHGTVHEREAYQRSSVSDSELPQASVDVNPHPLSWRVLAAILDPLTTRDEALGLAAEVERLS